MRYAFIKELTRLAKKNKNIVLLTADLGYTVFEDFAEKYPKQFYNVGVAEANMVSLAAGLALSGKVVFVYSIATFATLRTFEQIRNDVCLHNAPVVIVGSGAGLSYADAGPTHHAVEDLAVLRTLPNLTILSPADPLETVWATKTAFDLKGPVYIRLGKKGEPLLYKANTAFTLGKGSYLSKGKDFAVITTGNITENVVLANKMLLDHGYTGTVISMHTIKPFDTRLVLRLLKQHRILVTVEEHTLFGGLGSIVSEIIAESKVRNPVFQRIALPDAFSQIAGTQTYLREKYGLSPEIIAKKIMELLS